MSHPAAPPLPPPPVVSYGTYTAPSAPPAPGGYQQPPTLHQPSPPINELFTPLELSISCQGLRNMDVTSKSDPFVVVSELRGNQWVEVLRTETVKDNLNPKFTKPLNVNYAFETRQPFLFRVYDEDQPHAPLASQDFLGEVSTTLADLVVGQGRPLNLTDPRTPNVRCGAIQVNCEERSKSTDVVRLKMAVHNAPKVKGGGCFLFGSSKAQPYIEIERTNASENQPNNRVVVHRTDSNFGNSWALELPAQRLCGGDLHRPLTFKVMHNSNGGTDPVLGMVQSSVTGLAGAGANGSMLHLEDSHKRSAGSLNLTAIVEKGYSFFDYVSHGFEISMSVAIDFTGSNGDPRDPKSLHFKDPVRPNEYIKAIMSVGDIVAHYDKDQLFPVYGFGAKVPPSGNVSHCFPCTFNDQQTEVHGVQGILNVYASALQAVTLYGPTLFAPVINQCIASARQGGMKYHVLLILTDGVIGDMPATIDAIVAASFLPISIIIVGVGSDEFANMNTLDADDVPLKASNGTVMVRDIVQFVPYRKFVNAPYEALAQETLREVPEQFVKWARANRVPPPGRQWGQ